MYLYDKFVQDSKINAPDMEIQKESQRLSKGNKLIYDNKKSDDRNKYTQLVIDAGFDISTETGKFISYLREQQ